MSLVLTLISFDYLRPDISKGITTLISCVQFESCDSHNKLSKTWYLKRDYDYKDLSKINISLQGVYYLRPDISKGITTGCSCKPKWIRNVSILLSKTWYLKRDYDSPTTILSGDLTSYYLRPDISKGITTRYGWSGYKNPYLYYLRPDISKGITTLVFDLHLKLPS